MTSLPTRPELLQPAGQAWLTGRFRPIFERIALHAAQRDRARELPHEPVEWLKEAGFGALRVPLSHGGSGASIPQLFGLLIELAAADSNLPQALRGHFAFVEDRLNAHGQASQDVWFDRFARGQLVGNAWTEIGDVTIGELRTTVSRHGRNWLLDGTKYYTTGSLFADWIDVLARRADDRTDVIAVVNRHQPGVLVDDDWDGFGQVGTASGTARFERAHVEDADVSAFAERFRYQTAFYQLFHVATLAGIGRAVERETAALVRERTRIYSHGNASRARDDAQIQQVVGELAASAYAAQAITLHAAQALQHAYDAHFQGDVRAEHEANVNAELASAQAQLTVSDLVLRASTHLFDALGASATSTSKALDRHWRNARTVASHNPLVYKARIVGDWSINGTEPPYVWQIGASPAGSVPANGGSQ